MAVWVVVLCVGIAFHDFWKDEAQVWLMASHTSFLELWDYAQLENSPMLWHSVLWVISRLTDNPLWAQVANGVVIGLAVLLFLWRTDFMIREKVVCILGFYVLYQWGLICKNYGLSLLFVTGFLLLPRRLSYVRYLCLWLLPLTNAHSVWLALVLAGGWFLAIRPYDGHVVRNFVVGGVLLVSIIFAGFIVTHSPSGYLNHSVCWDGATPGTAWTFRPYAMLHSIFATVFPSPTYLVPSYVSILGGLAVLAWWRWYWRGQPIAFWLWVVWSAGLWAIFLFKPQCGTRHMAFVWLGVIVVEGIRRKWVTDFIDRGRKWFAISQLPSMAMGLCLVVLTTVKSHGVGEITADYLEREGYADWDIVLYDAVNHSPVVAYLERTGPKRVWATESKSRWYFTKINMEWRIS